ncbi:oxidoreductase [Simiduia sp. 21SJ11W-1]|uniref:oxidoreductase n=1 Tax=Simiduia sp. 21SJ11W-1 TaxID=2909669 RepID=UPI00209F2411|nr:oxidoreductase [Simiduia sp. 21SJ11W-1]UTA48034.1 oxidoreductase [Simiduia sp. 21SJ11W-1]
MTINVGVIGYGYAAQTFHLPLLAQTNGMHLCALLSSQPHLTLEGVQLYHQLEEFLAHPGLDAVVVTAPNDVHFALGEKILAHKLHLLLEKPMTVTLSQAQQLVALAQKNARLLTVFQNRRFDGDFLTVQSLIESGRLGALRYFESRFDRFRPIVRNRWRENAGAGAGIWFDLGPHLVDQALCLFGWPTAITARLKQMREHAQSVDYFHVQLHYPQLEVVLHSSPHCASDVQRFHVEGSCASLTIHGLDPQEAQLKQGLAAGRPGYGVNPDRYAKLSIGESQAGGSHSEQLPMQKGAYGEFYQQWACAIRGEGSVPVSGEQALQVMALLALAEQSMQQMRTLECANLAPN